ncbi:MAG: cation transporter [Saprospirales bacterium]|nr:cation transporter [Saprospirales bacterium]MBK8919959.1 cation transporter [Saprospirales bacterium]
MAHTHHDHQHLHQHGPARMDQLTVRFVWGIGLNLAYVAVEGAAGFITGSLALLTDAGHNLSDVGGLALALFAFHLARRQPTRQYSYGFRKFTIWASLLNGLLLLVAVGGIGYEAARRLAQPPQIPGGTVALIAGIGIAVNTLSAWLFYRDKAHDLNVKGAYLHLAADAAISAGVVLAGLLMHWTGWHWLDPVIGFLVLSVIIWSVWGLLGRSIRLALDGVPPQIDPLEIKRAALGIHGISNIHHVHIWAMSTLENALTAHLVLADHVNPEEAARVKQRFRHALEHMNIQHATLETEYASDHCNNPDCG